MKKFIAAVICMMSLSSFACAAEPIIEHEPAQNLSTSVDAFCWKYFATFDRDKNIFYSPYGINAALSILVNGASGETLKEIILALEADNVQNLNECHKNFSEYAAKNYDNFAEANLLLIDKKVIERGLDENFKRVVNEIYGSEVREADFENNLEDEKQKISRWVSEKTKSFIPDYKSIATKATLTDLLNVVYFKGKWAIPFKARATEDNTFTNCDGSEATVSMMNKVFKDSIAYHEDEKFKGIELPYSDGAAMYLIMPVDKSLNVAEAWNNESLSYRTDFIKGLSRSSNFDGEVVVRLPKFELDIENNLVENFKSIGITKSFTDDAEFFNIVNDTSLKIGNVQHRAKIKVDEEGTEAAAITEVVMVEATAAPDFDEPRTVYFIADRPFLFVIRDVKSNVTLFAGIINKL